MKKAIAVLIAVVILLSSSITAGSAISIEKNGKQYILRSHTPTTGDVNVLMVRVGFADYAVDDEDNPADSEQTLLSYFDGSAGSVNGFYETSSYGKLRLYCDRVYSYNAKHNRSDYDAANYDSTLNPDALMAEALEALEDEIDPEKFDSDGEVDIPDVSAIQRWLASTPLTFAFDEAVADASEDGEVSILDVTYIQRWLAELPSNAHIGKPINPIPDGIAP